MVKKLLQSVREYKKNAFLAPTLVLGEVVMEIVIPLLMANMIDFGINRNDLGYVAGMGALLVLASLVSLAFGVFAGRHASIAGAGFAKNLRKDLFYRLQTFSFSNIDHFSSSSLVTRLTTDVTNVQNAYQMIIRTAVRAPFMMLFAMIASFRINASLALIFLGAVPVLAAGLALIMTSAHKLFEKVFKTYDKLNLVVQENVRGIRVVKSFVREDHENAKFRAVSDSIFRDFSKAEKIVAWNSPLMQFCVYVCMLLISWFGAKLIVQSGNQPAVGMTTGQLLSLMSYTTMILMSLMMVSFIVIMVTISRASMERITAVLEEESQLHSPADPITEVADGSIRFDHVSFSYSDDPARLALTDICLDIPSGAVVGILGGTGSSKSTLVQLIPRLYEVTQGSLQVGGIDVRKYDMEALRNQVAMVLQKNVLFSGTIRDNLRWGDENATDEDIRRVCEAACCNEFIDRFPDGYDTWIEQGGSNVSGGQRQRLCIARALLKKPKILILDDSTSAVDTRTDAMIRKAFREYIPDTTKLIIAQRIASVEDADLVILMDGGRIAAKGSPDELMRTCPMYREIAESQRKGAAENAGKQQ